MKNNSTRSFKTGGLLVIAALLVTVNSVLATTHVVQFGGNLGDVFSPSSFSATVGDTVRWEGDFSMHTTTSTTIPAGAEPWNNASGTSFSYVIMVPGTYRYQCTYHASLGMVGSFTAEANAVLPGAGTMKKGDMLQLVTSGGRTYGQIYLSTNEFVSGSLYSIDGRKVSTIVNARLGAGAHAFLLPDRSEGMRVFRVFIGKREIDAPVL